jgi:DNA ligase-1
MFKVMLASSVSDQTKLRYPLLASRKLDGIRASVQGGKLVSRMLEDIPNVNVQARFKGLAEGLDGELIAGNPTAEDSFRRTTSIVMSDDKPALDVRFHIFDKYSEKGFVHRLEEAQDSCKDYAVFVEHELIENVEKLTKLTEKWLKEGYEGVMLRAPFGAYKQGRSSLNEGLLLRVKPMDDAEAIVIDVFELEHNGNVATQDNLGHTKRSTCQANFTGLDSLGGLVLKGIGSRWKDVEFRCGTGFKMNERKELWKEKEKLIGKIAKFKYQEVGSKDKPRLPIFLGWRDKRDM